MHFSYTVKLRSVWGPLGPLHHHPGVFPVMLTGHFTLPDPHEPAQSEQVALQVEP